MQIKIDWLSFSFEKQLDETSFLILQSQLSDLFEQFKTHSDDFPNAYESRLYFHNKNKGFMGFTSSFDIQVHSSDFNTTIGVLAFGGQSQKNRVFISFTGTATRYLNFTGLKPLLEQLNATITRLDIALDDFDGTFKVSDAVQWYKDGDFKTTKQPSNHFEGDVNGENGDTFYVGYSKKSKTRDKLIRIYEKGKQMEDKQHPNWVRWELEVHNKQREIPLDVLTNFKDYFFGSYPLLKRLFMPFFEVIKEKKLQIKKKLSSFNPNKMLDNLKKQYGKYFNTFLNANVSTVAIVKSLAVDGVPKKMQTEIQEELYSSLFYTFKSEYMHAK